MKVTKHKNEFGTIISFKESQKQLYISFGGNLDLYWSIRSEEGNNHHEFIITKENYKVYELFCQLFDDIENVKIFDEINKYKLFIHSNYNELFDKKSNTITWYSDETNHKVSNILKIKKEKESFKLDFYTQQYIEGYDRDFNNAYYIPIRFRNSGSSYDPFNIVFMRMYEKMKQIDDINDYGHQIHIEEYLYSQNKVKKMTKST